LKSIDRDNRWRRHSRGEKVNQILPEVDPVELDQVQRGVYLDRQLGTHQPIEPVHPCALEAVGRPLDAAPVSRVSWVHRECFDFRKDMRRRNGFEFSDILLNKTPACASLPFAILAPSPSLHE
jgi:hypothetical protein